MAPRRLLLVSYPRTASNLLVKILALPNQPDVLANDYGGYFFMDVFTCGSKDGRANKPADQWTKEECDKVRAAFQACLDEIERYSARAEKENKMLFTKEHAFWLYNPMAFGRMMYGTNGAYDSRFHLQFPEIYGPSQTYSPTNETIFSDEYLRTWRLAFLIRHPALVFPSFYRAMIKLMSANILQKDELRSVLEANMSLKWTRMLYDWGMENNDAKYTPLLLDAHDVIHNPRVVARFCELVGLDPHKLQFEWEKEPGTNAVRNTEASLEQRDTTEQESLTIKNKQVRAIMLSSLAGSPGVLRNKAPETVDVAIEASKWRKEFGEESGLLIETAVLAAMPDYEYLKARRITL
ncbi:hypothetical protein BDV28DRAFT_45475 [Aspergillus coremiiformis]|uniref:P-loop containing nucleoside triphosphate hydrolase protein n=1 Tax=Aspergillus coremiiformis TaxID=138285 RepID=A0A5N6ZCM0_9EURO|nr:hypothetical protein BDV28DRAFT_45475 [Aspergillus coremiiformis]